MRALPGLVTPREVDDLRSRFAAAARGEAFILQGGDCAERFVDCDEPRVRRQARALLTSAGIVESGLGLPVTVVGRIAGQYGKPRSTHYCLHQGGTWAALTRCVWLAMLRALHCSCPGAGIASAQSRCLCFVVTTCTRSRSLDQTAGGQTRHDSSTAIATPVVRDARCACSVALSLVPVFLFSPSHFWCMQRHFVCCEAWCPRRSRICLVLPMPFRVCSQRLAPVPLPQVASGLCPCQLVPVTRPWRVPGATLSLLSVAAWLMRGQLWYRGPRREPACSRHMRASA